MDEQGTCIGRHPQGSIHPNGGRSAEALELIERAATAPGPYADAVKQTRALILERLQQR